MYEVPSIADFGSHDNMMKYGTVLEVEKEQIEELVTKKFEYQGY